MTDKELKDMDETTSLDTTAAADTTDKTTVDVNEAVDDVLLSDADELPFDVDFYDDAGDADVATDVIDVDDGDRVGTVDNSNVVDDDTDDVDDDTDDVDDDTDDVDDETTGVDTTSSAPADGGADVVAANADHVNAMLSLATPRESRPRPCAAYSARYR